MAVLIAVHPTIMKCTSLRGIDSCARGRGPFALAMSRGEVLLELCNLLLKSGFLRWCCSKSSGDGGCRHGIEVTEGRSAGDNCWCVKKDSSDKIHECAIGNQWMVRCE